MTCRTKEHHPAQCRIFVDADACPVKDEIVRAAKDFCCEAIFVSSYAHLRNGLSDGDPARVKNVTVERAPQAADLYIANHVMPKDVVITDDLGLAALVVSKKGLAVTFRGKIITKQNIDMLLHGRYLSSKARRSGKKVKGPSSFDKDDAMFFEHTLQSVLQTLYNKKNS